MGDALNEFFSGSGLIDLVMLITVLEMVFLEVWLRRTNRREALWRIRMMLLPGLWLMLAVRSVSLQQSWVITAGFLLAAGCTHIADLISRLHTPEE